MNPPIDIEALALALGISLRPEYRAGVAENLRSSLALAAVVAAFPIEDDIELAPVFRA